MKVAENSVSGAQHRHVVRLLWREGSDAGMTVAGQLTPLVLPGCQQDTMPLGNDAEPGAVGCNILDDQHHHGQRQRFFVGTSGDIQKI